MTPCATCQLDGRCLVGCPDDPDCGCPSDGICTTTCANREDPDCTLGSINDTCAGAGSCEPGSFCVEGVCLRACEEGRIGACSTTEFCGYGTGESRSVCFTETSLKELQAGCTAGAGSSGPALLAIPLALFAVTRRRRARK